MKLDLIGKGGLFALSACVCAAAVAAPLFPLDPDSNADPDDELETTISVRTSAEPDATVVKVPELSVGETRTVTSEGGRPVEVTRTEKGFALKVGEKSYEVRVLSGGPLVLVGGGDEEGGSPARTFTVVSPGGKEGARCEKKVVVMEKGGSGERRVVVSPGAHAYWFGDAERPKAADLLGKNDLKALAGADARTRETVEKALDELIESGAVVPLPGHRLVTASGDGEQVEIKVIRKPRSEE
ncbi:MAG: hypothetical protein EDX89_12335 [Acidobacteria bacterium]|nr:MAG: hypothetical protein EDX89_12335 [Acidobacteriota bacterium]MCE7957386.1 hypothetical protein [Acidobacteria bacterium ACB2]